MTRPQQAPARCRLSDMAMGAAGGLNFDGANGVRGSVGGELGGIGNNFLTWSARGRVSFPLSF